MRLILDLVRALWTVLNPAPLLGHPFDIAPGAPEPGEVWAQEIERCTECGRPISVPVGESDELLKAARLEHYIGDRRRHTVQIYVFEESN